MSDDDFLTFRATFQFPKPRPDRMQLRIAAPIEVEVYKEEGRRLWRAREPKSKAPYAIIGVSSRQARDQIEELFEKRLNDWRSYSFGKPVDEQPPGALA